MPSRNEIIKYFWGSEPFSIESWRSLSLQGDSYFRYHEEQFRLMTHNGRQFQSAATYGNLVDIVEQLRDESHDRNSVRQWLSKRLKMEDLRCNSWQTVRTDESAPRDDVDDLADEIINLAMRLWLMMPIGGFRQVCGPERALEWESGSVHNFLQLQFPRHCGLKESVPLEKAFNARNLKRLGGIHIVWTNNLADHLRLRDDDTKVSVFHHATFLIYCRGCKTFPAGLVEETVKTLALLLPEHNKEVKRWYRRQQMRFQLDENAIKCGPLTADARQLNKFEYWHDRLAILKDAFDEAEPVTITQWWYDRRRRVQWSTFWVAALVLTLTVIFGVVQCVEGGIQAYKAYYPA